MSDDTAAIFALSEDLEDARHRNANQAAIIARYRAALERIGTEYAPTMMREIAREALK